MTLSGHGRLFLGNGAGERVIGTAGSQLMNVDNVIYGSGALGGGRMGFVNETLGVIDAASTAIVIDTGAYGLANAGKLVATGTGSLTIDSALANAGLIEVAGGLITLKGAVSGPGRAAIYAGLLACASTFTQSVAFGPAGTLELARSQAYSGAVTGFSKTGTTALDLSDIAFVGAGGATYHGTALQGVLTVTDGVHTAHINLRGDFTKSTFAASSDGHGGTTVVALSTAAFIAAAAGLRPADLAASSSPRSVSQPLVPLLAPPPP